MNMGNISTNSTMCTCEKGQGSGFNNNHFTITKIKRSRSNKLNNPKFNTFLHRMSINYFKFMVKHLEKFQHAGFTVPWVSNSCCTTSAVLYILLSHRYWRTGMIEWKKINLQLFWSSMIGLESLRQKMFKLSDFIFFKWELLPLYSVFYNIKYL